MLESFEKIRVGFLKNHLILEVFFFKYKKLPHSWPTHATPHSIANFIKFYMLGLRTLQLNTLVKLWVFQADNASLLYIFQLIVFCLNYVWLINICYKCIIFYCFMFQITTYFIETHKWTIHFYSLLLKKVPIHLKSILNRITSCLKIMTFAEYYLCEVFAWNAHFCIDETILQILLQKETLLSTACVFLTHFQFI